MAGGFDSKYTGAQLESVITSVLDNGTSWSAKQEKLVSGTNIKTINGNNILGSGDVFIESGKVDDVKVNGTSVVTEKVANIDLTGKQDVISDIATIRSGAAAGATAVQPATLLDYSTTTEMNTAIAAHHDSTKQDTISDLATIRSGAALGATSVQPAEIAGIVTQEGTGTIGTANTLNADTLGGFAPSDYQKKLIAGTGIIINDVTISVDRQNETDWSAVINQPKINNMTLESGDNTLARLGIQPAGDYAASSDLDKKQNKLIPGNNITIVEDTSTSTAIINAKSEAQNLLNSILPTTVKSGITATRNSDGTYTFTGTGTGTDLIEFELSGIRLFAAGPYRVCGCPANGSPATYRLEVRDSDGAVIGTDVGSGVDIVASSNPTGMQYVVVINPGVLLDSIIFKPMLTTSIGATYKDYKSYSDSFTRHVDFLWVDITSYADEFFTLNPGFTVYDMQLYRMGKILFVTLQVDGSLTAGVNVVGTCSDKILSTTFVAGRTSADGIISPATTAFIPNGNLTVTASAAADGFMIAGMVPLALFAK